MGREINQSNEQQGGKGQKMLRKLATVFLLIHVALYVSGCYTLKPYSPKDVKPDWDILYAVKNDSTVIRFDDENPANIEGRMVVGGVRNDFAEVRPCKIPLDSISLLRVRRPDTSTPMLIVAGLGVAVVAFWVIEAFQQHRGKAPSTGGGIASESPRH